MKTHALRLITGLVLTVLFLTPAVSLTADDPVRPCDILLDDSGKMLYILENGTHCLRAVPADGTAPAKKTELPMTPVRMRWLPDRKRIAVVGGIADGQLAVVRVKDDAGTDIAPAVESRFNAGHSPNGVAVYQHDEQLRFYVADRFAGVIREFDGETGEQLRVFDGGREPTSVEITPDGAFLAVANLLPEDRADVAYTTSRVRIVDLETEEVTPICLENGISNLYDLTLSPDGRLAFVTGTLGNYRTVTSQVEGGWIVDNITAVVDIRGKRYVDKLELDNKFRGAPNPWGITFSDDGTYIAVALSGSDEILLMSAARYMAKISYRLPADLKVPPIPAGDETAFPLRLRVGFGLKGIRRLAMKGNTVWGVSLFDDAVVRARVNLTPPIEKNELGDGGYPANPLSEITEDPIPPENETLRWTELPPYSPVKGVLFDRAFARLAPKPEETAVRRGEKLFCDALVCREHWQSCITCHPDARADGLSWDLLNDGVDNSKNTKSLLFSHETPPSMITGVRPDAETAVRAGVIHILFSSLPEEDYCAMDEYLKSLEPVPSPRLTNGHLNESAERGKRLFESSRTGCADCHSGPYFTDLLLHHTGSQDPMEHRTLFDTPTLREVWRTAPYLNTGHWRTIREALLDGKHANQDGKLDRLTPEELNDLIEYVLSL